MQFESANPRSSDPSDNASCSTPGCARVVKPRPLPVLADYRPDGIADELADMMDFDVEGCGDDARFLITQEGATLTKAYGNEHIDPGQRTNRYLDDAIGLARYARVLPSYRGCVMRRRPTYSVSVLQDADGKDVSYERLPLPFGSAGHVEQIVGSYKAISIEGGFKITDLMGVTSKATPVSVINAVIDLDFVRGPAEQRASDDIIELS